MKTPTMDDYVKLLCTLFERFVQEHPEHESVWFTNSNQMMLVLFTLFQHRRIFQFKAQRRWLEEHPEMGKRLGWTSIPHRVTLSRRYKALYPVLQAFVPFVGQYANDVDARFRQRHLVSDKSLFKALGPVWHEVDRQAQRIPAKLRHLDTDATWSKSGYHGWVYGYGLPLTCNEAAFPALVPVETAAVAEATVIEQQQPTLWHVRQPTTLTADNSYAKASRIRRWAKQGVVLLSPASKWRKGRFAQAYHRYLKQPANVRRLRQRRTTIEPLFDLMAKVLGTTAKQKHLPVQCLPNVRTCLALATLSVQLAMLVNSIWGLPLRNISTMITAFA